MKVAFLHSDKPREIALARAFLAGAARHGHRVEAISLGDGDRDVDCDVVAMVGVKSRERFHSYLAKGQRVLMLDKGYARHHIPGLRTWEYWRVAIDAHQPTRYLTALDCPDDRAKALAWEPKPWRTSGSKVVIAGSSEKYHAFCGLPHPTRYARGIATQLSRLTQLTIVYRPKPSWRAAQPLKRAVYSRPPESLSYLLDSTWALVTHGSNACFDAVMAGVPCIILGDAAARGISSTYLEAVEAPHLASDKDRTRWLANLAYFQWTEPEMESGAAWDFLGELLDG